MKKTLLTLSLCATLLSMMSTSARAVVLMDEDINISFSLSNNFNFFDPNPARKTIDNTTDPAYSGTHSLEEAHPEDLNVWGGIDLSFEEQLGGNAIVGAGADASDAERNMSQFDDTGKVELTWWYKVLQPIDLNTDGNPANDTSIPNILPVSGISLRYNDQDHLKDDGTVGGANEDLTSVGTYNMIVDGQWHQGSVIVNVLSAAARAALDENSNDDPHTASVWQFKTDISSLQTIQDPPNPSDFAGAPTFFFIDMLEMNAVPEPATLGLLGIGLAMTALGRRRRA